MNKWRAAAPQFRLRKSTPKPFSVYHLPFTIHHLPFSMQFSLRLLIENFCHASLLSLLAQKEAGRGGRAVRYHFHLGYTAQFI